jgi:two-component system phosphate regulon sensor histidine kinase PhoR
LHSIRWRLSIPYVVLILVLMLLLVLYLSSFMRDLHLESKREQLLVGARLIGQSLAVPLAEGQPLTVYDPAADQSARLLGARVTIIGMDGKALGESHRSMSDVQNLSSRLEVRGARVEESGSDIRPDSETGADTMYVATLVRHRGQPVGIVRLALPLDEANVQITGLQRTLLLVALVATFIAAVTSVIIAERTVRPVQQLTQVAERLADGDLNARLYLKARDEVGILARAFNHMADQLREQVTTLAEEESLLSAILEGMADGVIITEEDGRVRLINSAAARLMGTARERALGHSFAQVVRQHELIDLWHRCREWGEEQSIAVEVERRGLFLQAIARPFTVGDSAGYLVMLQDLTRIRRLETVRRDFISNVSHELRTPLAGLKALVDTLRDGALEDPPAAQRFLDRMETEVDALTQMVEELLELSRIESGRLPLRLRPTPVGDLVLPPVERLSPQAERADLTVEIELPPDLPLVLAEEERVQQVVTNLVHNAIKFTPEKGRIEIQGRQLEIGADGSIEPGICESVPDASLSGDWVLVSVKDTGIGIPPEDLSRIFERFYKADRARSGGGTGLGLAIAKHIVQAHGGQIWAESVEGKGSTFYFTLPVV